MIPLARWLIAISFFALSPSLFAEEPPEVRLIHIKTWEGCTALKKEHRKLGKKVSKALGKAGIHIVEIADSKRNGLFRNWHEACQIKTEDGVLEVVFFPEAAPGKKAKIEEVAPKDGVQITHVTSPDGQTVEVQGNRAFHLVGAHVWVSTEREQLRAALSEVTGLP